MARLQTKERTALALILALGLVLRLVMAWHLTGHIDEPASVLALQQVAKTGLPILPSGMLYLQGATVSYLLAPLYWLGLGDLGDLFVMRLPAVLWGTTTIGVLWAIVRRGAGPGAALFASFLASIDLLGVQWSANIRPYALLCLTTALLIWRFQAVLLDDRPRRSDLVALPLLAAFGTFTHVGMLMVLPLLGLVAWGVYGRQLFGSRRDVLIAWLLCFVGPALFFGLNSLMHVTSAGDQDDGASVAFVGNHLINLDGLTSPSFEIWRRVYRRVSYVRTVQATVGLATLAALWHAVRHGDRSERVTVALLALTAWPPVLAVALLMSTPQARYLSHVHTLELGLVAMGVAALVGTATANALLRATSRVVGLLLGSIMVGGLVTSLEYRWQHDVVSSVYEDVFTVLRERQRPGELILVAMPPVAWLSLPEQRAEIRFLAGSAGRVRTDRYTFADGKVRRDFWLGSESVTSVRQLCEVLSENPGSWVALDQGRLNSRSIYGGDMNTVLRNATAIHRLGRGGVRLSRVRPEHAWAGAARSTCDRHRGRAVVAPSGWGQTNDP